MLKRMPPKVYFIIPFIMACLGCSHNQKLDQKLDKIALRPENPMQMCFGIEYGNDLLLFGFTRDYLQISPKQFSSLREDRNKVLKIIQSKIKNFDLAEIENSNEEHDTLYYNKVMFKLESYLLIVTDLNGSELLEDLLDLSTRIKKHLSKKDSTKNTTYINRLYRANLSTILCLLYYEQDQELLKTEFYQLWKKETMHKYYGSETRQEIKTNYHNTEGGNNSAYDPWLDQYYFFWELSRVKLTPEVEESVYRLARGFIQRVPVQNRARAKNIIKIPISR